MRIKLNRNYDNISEDNFQTVDEKDDYEDISHNAHRYLREYQYNGCQPFDRKPMHRVQNKENISVNQHSSEPIPVKNRNQSIKYSTNNKQKLLQKIDDKVLMSKQQVVLIKHLREQNKELRMQMLKKNSYIEELQCKLEGCLQQRIENLKQSCEFNKNLQSKLLIAENQINTLQQELAQTKHQLNYHQDWFSKICHIFGTKKKPTFEKQQLQRMFKQVEQTSAEKTILVRFIREIGEMKRKIQSKSNLRQSFNIQKNLINIDLKQLWRWLKNVAKQYQIIKQKLHSIQNIQVLTNT